MNTGVQRSSSTPFGASTTTSPSGTVQSGQLTWKKDMVSIAAAHKIPYIATATPSYPLDLTAKVKKAASTAGPAYLHIFSVCPVGWGIPSDMTVKLGRLAVECGVFPLYEISDGKTNITVDIENFLSLEHYLKPQKRFRHLTAPLIESMRRRIESEWEQLRENARRSKEQHNGY